MITQNNFSLFDPNTMDRSVLPTDSGNYIFVLRHNSSLPIKVKVSTTPELTPFEYKGESFDVIYVGETNRTKGLRTRLYKDHLTGTAGKSTFRKSLGALFGFKQIPRDRNYCINRKTKFDATDESVLTEWIKDNLLVFYYANNDCDNVEIELINTYNPPLNVKDNHNPTNKEFRDELSLLRSSKVGM